MRWRLFGLLLGTVLFPAGAAADPVVMLGPGGRAVTREDRFLTVPAITPTPSRVTTVATASVARHRKPKNVVASELTRLYRAGSITQPQYSGYKSGFRSAIRTAHRLRGTRRFELDAVVGNLEQIAAARLLTPSRLPALFLTLSRNQQYWRSGPLLSYGQRIEFTGSQLVWEYYPGQGIELTALGNFAKADGLYSAGRSEYPALQELLGELIPLAARRAGGLAWEYYFQFDGGRPPWVSAMSQGTALKGLTRGYQALQRDPALQPVDYLAIAHQALPLFTRAPPLGVSVPTRLGSRYVQYSFAPRRRAEVINGFLQSLIGLYDYARVSGDPAAAALFAAGNAEAQAEVPRFDTGAWSLYQPGQEDSLDYHELVTGFLQQLCSRTSATVYCTTAQHFQSYLKTPPALSLLTSHARVRTPFSISFRLSKLSRVGVVLARGASTVLATSASFPYGVHSFLIPPLRHRGTYTVVLTATDLAGNFTRTVGTVQLRRR